VCSSLCTVVAHNTAQNRPDSFPSCPPERAEIAGLFYMQLSGFDGFDVADCGQLLNWRVQIVAKLITQ